MTWTPVMCVAVIAFAYVIGEYLSSKTNGYISSMVFACFIALALFWTNLIPKDVATTSTLLGTLNAIGVAFLLINVGTSIDLENLIQEWKTVVVCCVGLVALGILAFTVGIAIFGREYSLVAAPIVSGGVIAYQIVSEEAIKVGKDFLSGYGALVMAFQSVIGMPVASICLKQELKSQKAKGFFNESAERKKAFKLPETKLFPDPNPKYDSSTVKFFKLAVTATVAYLLSTYVFKFLNVNIMYLLVGVAARKLNFLQKNPLNEAGGYGFIMMCMYSMLFNGFANVSIQGFLQMIFPIVGMLVLGAAGIAVGSLVAGKIVGYNVFVSMACGVTALFGYPGTEILSREVVNSMTDFTEEEKAKALDYVMPKMIVGGFTTVTIASVVFAGIVAPTIFR